jgi:preprotein translocase subunit YajC
MAWPDKLLFAVLSFIAISLVVPLLTIRPAFDRMSWVEKLLFAVLAFQAFALIAWFTMLRREMREEKKKIH